MTNPVTTRLEIIQYKDKHVMEISNLLEYVWLDIFPWPTEIMYG